MSTYLLFLLLGLGAGAVYAHARRWAWCSSTAAPASSTSPTAPWPCSAPTSSSGCATTGELQLPVDHPPAPDHRLGDGLPAIWAAARSRSSTRAVLGLVLYSLVYRPLLRAAPLTRVCASVGIDARAAGHRGAQLRHHADVDAVAPALRELRPRRHRRAVGPAVVRGHRDRGRRGARGSSTATRASAWPPGPAAENERGAALIGLSANRIAAQNWVIATRARRAVAGILIAPISTVDPTSYTLFIVPGARRGAGRPVRVVRRSRPRPGSPSACSSRRSRSCRRCSPGCRSRGCRTALPFLLILVAMTLQRAAAGAPRRRWGLAQPVDRAADPPVRHRGARVRGRGRSHGRCCTARCGRR